MNDKPFFDTNVILYAFRQDDTRGQVAETLLAAGGALSVQVLNEFVAVARRKLDKSWEEVRRALDILRVFCPEPVPLTVETHERAVHIAERYGYSIFDSLIIAAALHAGARHTLHGGHARWPGDRRAYNSQSIFALDIRIPPVSERSRCVTVVLVISAVQRLTTSSVVVAGRPAQRTHNDRRGRERDQSRVITPLWSWLMEQVQAKRFRVFAPLPFAPVDKSIHRALVIRTG